MTKREVIERIEEIKELHSIKNNEVNSLMKITYEDYSEETGEMTVSFPVDEWMSNPGGLMHGGVIATAFDIALGYHTLVVEREKAIVTTNLSIQYLKQIPLGSRFVVKSKMTRNGKSLVHLHAEGFVEGSDEIVATSTCTYMKLDSGVNAGTKMKV